MESLSRKIKLNGDAFHYTESGNPSAPAIVALHSLGSSSESWDQVAARLGDSYHFLALDQRGHGESARMKNYSFEEMCEDLFHFVNELKLEKFILLGHSMGGTISYLFAQKYGSILDKLIIVDTPPPFPDTLKEIPPKPDYPLLFDWNVFQSIMEQLNEPNPEWWEKLPVITTPTLIIGGAASNIPQDKLREVAELIPDCQFESIEGAGHRVHHDRLEEFLSSVVEFLG